MKTESFAQDFTLKDGFPNGIRNTRRISQKIKTAPRRTKDDLDADSEARFGLNRN